MPPTRIPDVQLRLNGKRAPRELEADLDSLTVQDDLDALSMFTLVLYNWDQDRQRVTWSDSALLTVGSEVDIRLGYLDDVRRVMIGEITGLEPTFTAADTPTVTVRGYDHRHRLARGRRTRTFTGMSDSAIARRVAVDAGLGAAVRETGVTLDYVVQSNQSDLEFLRKRAGLIGYEVYVRDRKLYFQPPQHAGPVIAKLRLGQDLTEFTPRLSSLDQPGDVAVHGWDAAGKQPIVGISGTGWTSTTMGGGESGPGRTSRVFAKASAVTVDAPVQSKAEADHRARGLIGDLALTYIQGEAECAGDPRLRAGGVVRIDGAGTTFSGTYYLGSVTHELTQSEGYRTQLSLRRNAA